MMSDRIVKILEDLKESWTKQPQSHFNHDMHEAANLQYSHLEQWEKIARSMAYAITNQSVYIKPYDKLIGRVYHLNEKRIDVVCRDLDYSSAPYQELTKNIEDYKELREYQLCGGTGLGHIAWFWDRILTLGTSGMKQMYTEKLQRVKDSSAIEFYKGVLIMLDALDEWNDQHVAELEQLGMLEMAQICKRVPKYPARSFHEAVQSFFIQYIVVMRENPFGGNGPGRLDYYLWPYLEKDLRTNACTLQQARELIDELFLRIDERIHKNDGWVEAIVVGGSYPNGLSAVNPLSYMMIESIMDLNITHPSVYIRLPENPSEDFVELCAKYLKHGSNRAQVLSDTAIIEALNKNGVFTRDAIEYVCGGCMEIGVQGMTSDFLFNGWVNIPKMVELSITGGECLTTSKKLNSFRARGLGGYTDFQTFYNDFIEEARRLLHIFFKAQDVYSETAEKARPSYLISSMIDDCFARGRNMHAGGAKYHDYGLSPLGLANAADSLFAIKKAVFDGGICTAGELIKALKANFEGYKQLQFRLRAIPKYGQQHHEADEMARALMSDICTICNDYHTRWGGKGKAVVLTFLWAPVAGALLGATADGNPAGRPIAHGITPQSSSMSMGLTTALNSCMSMPQEMFSGGASTMWDLDSSWATTEIIQAIMMTYMKNGGQIYQGNTTDEEILLKAQKHPEDYWNLIVRVGGFSARFVNLDERVQNDIIMRHRHHG